MVGLATPTKVFGRSREDIEIPDAVLLFIACNGPAAVISSQRESSIAAGDVFVSRAQDLSKFTFSAGTEGEQMMIAGGEMAAALRALGVSDACTTPGF